jgi:hypothetical protein
MQRLATFDLNQAALLRACDRLEDLRIWAVITDPKEDRYLVTADLTEAQELWLHLITA